ncbi:hypothetical protein [Rhodohalobacter sp. 8-1]|uniref:hypothetical protein n=1 Tax=Rhodohalobacter sp. 8-1 TaxID=3131972 RepID=UPI0030EF3DED
MCGRYTLIENLKDLEEWFDADRVELDELQPNYNVPRVRRRLWWVRMRMAGDPFFRALEIMDEAL